MALPYPIPFTAIAFLIFCYVSLVRRYRTHQALKVFLEHHRCEPAPQVRNHRPFGIDRVEQIFRADREGRLMEELTFHFRQTGHTLKQVLLGITAFDTIEPANLEAVLSTKFEDFNMGKRRAITLPMFGDGIFTQEGAAWMHSRELLRSPLQHRHYENLDVFKQGVDDLLDVISCQSGVVDLQPLFFRLTLDITTEFLFGESVRSLKGPTSTREQSFGDAFNTAQKFVVKRFQVADFYWIIGGAPFKKACDDVHNFADQIIDRNLSRSSERGRVFLDALADNTTDRASLRGQIINLLAAGRDTTACLLTWTFFLLVRHPDVLEKLAKEIDHSCSNPINLTRTKLRKMGYLQNVLKETSRLYPSVPLNNRTASRTTILPTGGGPQRTAPVLIPEGTMVAWSVYAMHRRPDLYGMDAELFRPERWDEDMPMRKNKTNASWGYLPFNGGPRICIGMDFALTEAAYTVIRLLQRFPNMRLPASEKVDLIGTEKQTMTIVVGPREGCLVDIDPTEKMDETQ